MTNPTEYTTRLKLQVSEPTAAPSSQGATPLPKPFDAILEELVRGMPMQPQYKPSTGRKALFDAFMRSVTWVDTKRTDLQQFLEQTVETNIEVRVEQAGKGRELAIARDKLRELAPHVPRIPVEEPSILRDWNVAAQPVPEIQRQLLDCLHDLAERLVTQFLASLNVLRDRQFVGVILYHPEDATVAQYEFFRSVVVQSNTGESRRTERVERARGKSSEVWERVILQRRHTATHRNARHLHVLYDAATHAWNDSAVRRPKWIDAYLRAIPAVVFQTK